MKTFFTLLFVACFALQAQGQASKLPLDSDYHLINVKDGSATMLSQYKSQTLVLLFVQNNCAFVDRYEDRIAELIGDYAQSGIGFVLINPNTNKDPQHENTAAMKKKLAAWGWAVDYLADGDQLLTQKANVHKVPQAVVIQTSSGKIIYKGPIDDNPQVAQDVEHAYLKEILSQLKKGINPSPTQKMGMGCMVQRF